MIVKEDSKGNVIERLHHKRHPDFEVFDKVTLEVVERWKDSELSGDEWRFSILIKFYFKGEVVYEGGGYGDMRSALMMLGSEYLKASCPVPTKLLKIEEVACSQPGCKFPAVARFRLKRETSERGEIIDPSDLGDGKYRQFCAKHKHRGDCSREDADANYILLDDASNGAA